MAANRRRLAELGMATELAKEVAAQIDAGGTGSAPAGRLTGLGLTNDGTDATNDLQVAAGSASDDTAVYPLTTTSTIIKQIDVVFTAYTAPGTASGGRDPTTDLTGAKFFHVFLIGALGKNTQPFFATSMTPTLPTGFTYKRRIGSVYWTGSAIKAFVQSNDTFQYLASVTDLTAAAWTSTATTQQLTVPSGVKVEAMLSMSFTGVTAGNQYARIEDLSVTDGGVTATRADCGAVTGQNNAVCFKRVLTNTSGQVRKRSSDAAGTGTINTIGWVDTRGRG